MAIQTFKQGVAYPFHPNININGGAPSTTSDTLDNTADRLALVFIAPKDGNISTIDFALGSVGGASGNVTVDVRVETVDGTTGNPTGTLWAANTNATATVAFNDDNTWKSVTLTSSATVSRGDTVAIVLNPLVFTTVTNCQIMKFQDVTAGTTYGTADLTGGGYTKAVATYSFIAGYDDTTYEPIYNVFPARVVTTTSFNSGSSPPVRGMKFQVPFKCRVNGMWAWMALASTSSDFDAKIYSSDGSTVLASHSFDATNSQSGTTSIITVLPFDDTVTLSVNTNYYLSIEPTSANNVTLYTGTLPSNAKMDAWPGGKNMFLSTLTSGTWTDTDTERPFMGILLDGFDDGQGAYTF